MVVDNREEFFTSKHISVEAFFTLVNRLRKLKTYLLTGKEGNKQRKIIDRAIARITLKRNLQGKGSKAVEGGWRRKP